MAWFSSQTASGRGAVERALKQLILMIQLIVLTQTFRLSRRRSGASSAIYEAVALTV